MKNKRFIVGFDKASEKGDYTATTIINQAGYSENEVKALIQVIYSEFAELPIKRQNTSSLRQIIEQEVEQHPLKPIKIFK